MPRDQAEKLLAMIERDWGKGVACKALVASEADDDAMRTWWRRHQRLAASPGAAVALLRSAFETDARGVVSTISVPTLILHRVGDPFTGPEHGRYLAEQIPGARYVELSGVDHLFFAEDTDRLVAEIQKPSRAYASSLWTSSLLRFRGDSLTTGLGMVRRRLI